MDKLTFPVPLGPIEKEKEKNNLKEKDIELPNFSFLLSSVIKSNYTSLLKHFKKNLYWLIPLFIIWIILWNINDMTLYTIPSFLRKIIMTLIFITGTYNGFLGKAVFLSVINRNIIPMIKSIKNKEFTKLINRYKKVYDIVKKSLKTKEENILGIFVAFMGISLIVSNLLTRNNKFDKYLVCLLLGFSIIDDVSKGKNHMVTKLFLALVKDGKKLIKKDSKTSIRSAYGAATGFASGSILAFIPGLFANSYVSFVGTFLGIVVFFIGVFLYFYKREKIA
jgi:hypothetical protein